MLHRQQAHLLIMGDFNDNPGNKSLSGALKAKKTPSTGSNNIEAKSLYNLFHPAYKKRDYGTYKYQGVWEIMDQFIVNGNLLTDGNPVKVKGNEAYVYYNDFLLEEDHKYYGVKPFRTNIGPRYNGGFSDHLPIFLDINITDQ